jgi:hypothetical protein
MCVSYVVPICAPRTGTLCLLTKKSEYRAPQSIMAFIDFNPLCVIKPRLIAAEKPTVAIEYRCDAIHTIKSIHFNGGGCIFTLSGGALESEQTLSRRQCG